MSVGPVYSTTTGTPGSVFWSSRFILSASLALASSVMM